MSGSVGVASQLDVETEFRQEVYGPSSGLRPGFEMGLGAQPTQPPHPPLEVGMAPTSVSGYHDVFGMAGTSGYLDLPEGTSGFHRCTTVGDDVILGTADIGDISTTAATTPTSDFIH